MSAPFGWGLRPFNHSNKMGNGLAWLCLQVEEMEDTQGAV